MLRRLDVGLDRAHRALDDQPHPDRGRQVEYLIGVVHQLGEERDVFHGPHDVAEPGLSLEVTDVPNRTCGKVIQHGDRIPPRQESLREMRPDEPRPSRNQVVQSISFVSGDRVTQNTSTL